MSSTFSCYQTAKSGMYVSQIALDVTSHNVSNANTEGYVRQQAMNAAKTPTTYAQYQLGTGVEIEEIRQIRNNFLDNSYRSENSLLGYWNTRQKTVEDVEAILADFSDENGLKDAIDQFFDGWEELAKDPQNRTARESLREYGNSFIEEINQISNQLDLIQKDLDNQITSTVDEINDIASNIAELNQKILEKELNGDNANDYRDQVNVLIDTLSTYVKIDTNQTQSGMIEVTVGGAYLVNGNSSIELSCKKGESNGVFSSVVWSNSGVEAKLSSGKLLALIQSRGDVNGDKGSSENGSPIESENVDDDSSTYTFFTDSDNIISQIRTGLNNMVNLMTRKINEIHSSGIGLDGSTGVDFFVKINDTLPFEAGNIIVNTALDDPNKIAASLTGNEGDSSNATKIADFKEEKYYKNNSQMMNIDDYYTTFINWIGTAGQEAESFSVNQNTLVEQIKEKKQSISSVSLDEEMTNLLKFQHAYTASTKVMNMIDSMLDQIINRMGTVGR